MLFALKTPAFCSTKYCTWRSNTDHPFSVPAFDLQRTLPAHRYEGTGTCCGLPFVPSTCIPAGSSLSTSGSVCWSALSSNPAGNWSFNSTSLLHDHWELNQFCWVSPSFLPRLVPLQMIISQVHPIQFQMSQDQKKKQKFISFSGKPNYCLMNFTAKIPIVYLHSAKGEPFKKITQPDITGRGALSKWMLPLGLGMGKGN